MAWSMMEKPELSNDFVSSADVAAFAFPSEPLKRLISGTKKKSTICMSGWIAPGLLLCVLCD